MSVYIKSVPKPVHPHAIIDHGLISNRFVKLHWMIDKRWGPHSISDDFKRMTELLSKHQIFAKMEWKNQRKLMYGTYNKYRFEVQDGRQKLKSVLYSNVQKKLRSILKYRKELVRKFQKMPLQHVDEYLDHRTFMLRKEKDRLMHRLRQMKIEYKKKLIEGGAIENRIKFANEFILKDDERCKKILSKIEDSHVRLRGILQINNVYKLMIRVLRSDAIFYEKILDSLEQDVIDQENFINYVIHLGLPGIPRLYQLSSKLKDIYVSQQRSSKKSSARITQLPHGAAKMSMVPARRTESIVKQVQLKERYVRETKSMNVLKNELEKIESVIKMVQFATVAQTPGHVIPNIKDLYKDNVKLRRIISLEKIKLRENSTKRLHAEVLADVLRHNLSEAEKRRIYHIQLLQQAIKEEDDRTADLLKLIKHRSDIFILMRYTLWTLNDILRYVGNTRSFIHPTYKTSYLFLPLLKYDMLTSIASPPRLYEADLNKMMKSVQTKLALVMNEAENMDFNKIPDYVNDHHYWLLDKDSVESSVIEPVASQEDIVTDLKISSSVPSRKWIKQRSQKIVEDHAKED